MPKNVDNSRRRKWITVISACLLLPIAMLSLVLAPGFVVMLDVVTEANPQRAVADLETLKICLERFRGQAGFYPTTTQGLSALVTKPTAGPVPRQWTPKTATSSLDDPWGRSYQYRNPGQRNPERYDLWSLGPDGEDTTSDDIWPSR